MQYLNWPSNVSVALSLIDAGFLKLDAQKSFDLYTLSNQFCQTYIKLIGYHEKCNTVDIHYMLQLCNFK